MNKNNIVPEQIDDKTLVIKSFNGAIGKISSDVTIKIIKKVNLSIIYLLFLFIITLFMCIYYQLFYDYVFIVIFAPLILLAFYSFMQSVLNDTTKHFGPIIVSDVNFNITGTKYVLFYRPGKSTITTKLKRFIDMYRFRHICIPFDTIKEYQLFYVKWKPGIYPQSTNITNTDQYYYIGTEIITTDDEKYWFVNWIFDDIRKLLEAPSKVLTSDINDDYIKVSTSNELFKKIIRTHGIYYISLGQRLFSNIERDIKNKVDHAIVLTKQKLSGIYPENHVAD